MDIARSSFLVGTGLVRETEHLRAGFRRFRQLGEPLQKVHCRKLLIDAPHGLFR